MSYIINERLEQVTRIVTLKPAALVWVNDRQVRIRNWEIACGSARHDRYAGLSLLLERVA
jgi:hypothetical protein